RAVSEADAYRNELLNKVKFIKQAILETPALIPDATSQLYKIESRLVDANTKLNGDASLARREFETQPSISGRVSAIESSLWTASSAPTQTFVQSYETASRQFTPLLDDLKGIDNDIKKLEDILEQNKAP